ncbi:glycoside hydrolase family 31 protein [Phytoactinopolyspora halotolerans]|uniref:Family 31 glucosidase n=1 Tax=Phytoactinopolyspora halotolerans TaxID=1981512 RepID=A0A6L9S8I1_9ACTN|nr:TIM-barrel domain-containing protein [Phytoactinopolyspora halotolerans]NEE00892.1 family 31 glucosidase [Phytoactinopolyspora halotolerans]
MIEQTLPADGPFQVDGLRLTWRGGGETVVVEPWGKDSVRVRSALGADVADTDWALLVPEPGTHAAARLELDGDTAVLVNGRIRVEAKAREFFDAQLGYPRFSCRLSFYDVDGRLLLRETGDGGALKIRARDYDAQTGGTCRTRVLLDSDPAEKLYGMGQYQQDILDIKGCTFELAHRNSQVSVPFVLSSAGYGFLWHNPAIGRATFAANRTEWEAESARQIDYWVTAGSSPAEITRAYAAATGHVPMMPEYGLGLWQSKLRYVDQEQLLDVAREYRRRDLPLDVIVADFFHWPRMGDFRFEEEFWPDPAAMVAELTELGVELMVSVWPQVSHESENYAEMSRRGLLALTNRGVDIQMQFGGPSRFVDVTNPAARAYVWEKCRENYARHGIRMFWLDEAEPEYGSYDYAAYRYHLGQAIEVGNLYPQLFSRAFYNGMTDDGAHGEDSSAHDEGSGAHDEGSGARDGGDGGSDRTGVVNLVRCAWAGSQRYGALVWSGDIHSSFPSMRRQVTAGIHMGVAGIPWFTTDIGGFGGGHVDDPAFRELLVRWFQLGAFLPVMRMHGDRAPSAEVYAADGSPRRHTGAGNELWSYGPDVFEILSRYARLREAMRDYTRDLMRQAHADGQPVMRGMFHEFPDDPVAWELADQFLFGPDLLVAPVMVEGATSRRVYLPAGASWTDLRSGNAAAGSQWIDAEAPLDVIPVFARNGALPELAGKV